MVAELGRGELGVEGKAHYGGAYDRMRVRTRVNAGAWQGLQRRLKAPSHRAAPALNAFRKSSAHDVCVRTTFWNNAMYR